MIAYIKSLINSTDSTSPKNAAFLWGVIVLSVLLIMFGIGILFGKTLEIVFGSALTAFVGLVTLHKDSASTTPSNSNTEIPIK
jgi:hypothetical protein